MPFCLLQSRHCLDIDSVFGNLNLEWILFGGRSHSGIIPNFLLTGYIEMHYFAVY